MQEYLSRCPTLACLQPYNLLTAEPLMRWAFPSCPETHLAPTATLVCRNMRWLGTSLEVTGF